MATYRSGDGQWNTTSGNKVSSTIAPAIGDLWVVFVGNTDQAAAPTLSDDNTGGTYTEITSAIWGASLHRASVFIRNNLFVNTNVTTCTMVPGTTTGGGFRSAMISGMTLTGASASRQTAKQDNQAGGTTPAPAFGVAALTTNLVLGACYYSSAVAAATPPSGWTERIDQVYSTPSASQEIVSIDSGFTGTTVTWGASIATAYCSIIIELDTSTGAVAQIPYTNPMPQLIAQ
jgi:hypothetical protein